MLCLDPAADEEDYFGAHATPEFCTRALTHVMGAVDLFCVSAPQVAVRGMTCFVNMFLSDVFKTVPEDVQRDVVACAVRVARALPGHALALAEAFDLLAMMASDSDVARAACPLAEVAALSRAAQLAHPRDIRLETLASEFLVLAGEPAVV